MSPLLPRATFFILSSPAVCIQWPFSHSNVLSPSAATPIKKEKKNFQYHPHANDLDFHFSWDLSSQFQTYRCLSDSSTQCTLSPACPQTPAILPPNQALPQCPLHAFSKGVGNPGTNHPWPFPSPCHVWSIIEAHWFDFLCPRPSAPLPLSPPLLYTFFTHTSTSVLASPHSAHGSQGDFFQSANLIMPYSCWNPPVTLLTDAFTLWPKSLM